MVAGMELYWRIELHGGVRIDFQPVVAIHPGRHYFFYTLWGFNAMSDAQIEDVLRALRPLPKPSGSPSGKPRINLGEE
jgi:hypothetical protein